MIYKSRALDFAFRKPEFNTIYYRTNRRPSIIFAYEGGGVQNLGKPAYIILEHSLCPEGEDVVDRKVNVGLNVEELDNGKVNVGGLL